MVTDKAPEGHEFRMASGRLVKSIEELLNYLRECSDKEYEHHVSPQRNDFAIWVSKVHDREDLAEKLDDSSSRKEAVKILHEEVKSHYEDAMKEVGNELSGSNRNTGAANKPEGSAISSQHGEFLTKEFVYGLIFGFVLGLLTYSALANVL